MGVFLSHIFFFMRTPFALVDEAWSRTQRHISLYASIYILPLIATIAFGYMTEQFFPVDGRAGDAVPLAFPWMIGTYLIALAVIIVVSVGGSLALLKAVTNPDTTTFTSAYRYSFKNLLAFLVLSVLVGVITGVGFLLLIIPGIIFSVWFLFSQFVFVLEGKRSIAAMKASREYVRGKWWAVFYRLVVLMLVMLVVYVPLSWLVAVLVPGENTLIHDALIGILNLVLVPFSLLYFYLLYTDITKAPHEA